MKFCYRNTLMLIGTYCALKIKELPYHYHYHYYYYYCYVVVNTV